jgi:hypothetical protein
VLDRIGHVDIVAIDSGLLQTVVEEQACGSNEGLTLDVLTVAGLLADEDQSRVWLALSEDGLRRVLVERTAFTARGRFAERREVPARFRIPRKEIGRGTLGAWIAPSSELGCARGRLGVLAKVSGWCELSLQWPGPREQSSAHPNKKTEERQLRCRPPMSAAIPNPRSKL